MASGSEDKIFSCILFNTVLIGLREEKAAKATEDHFFSELKF